jgi:hypothetical protein
MAPRIFQPLEGWYAASVPGFPSRPGCRDVRDHLAVGHVVVEERGVRVREAARVGEHVADRAALLAVAPAVDVVADPIVEAEVAPLPELEHRHHRRGLARRIEQHEVVALERPAGPRFAHRRVEQDLAPHRDVALRPVVPALGALPFEDLDDPGEVGLGRTGDRHPPRSLGPANCLTAGCRRVPWADVSQPRAQAQPDK